MMSTADPDPADRLVPTSGWTIRRAAEPESSNRPLTPRENWLERFGSSSADAVRIFKRAELAAKKPPT